MTNFKRLFEYCLREGYSPILFRGCANRDSPDSIQTASKEFVMLVLSRKQGESIVIANDIVVNIVDIGPAECKLASRRRRTIR